jgi:4-carboxymuconolactone decarboxylase
MPPKKPTVYEFIPKLGQLRDDVLFGDVWEHPDLSKRDRSLITVAMLAALYRTDEMRGHMQRALDNGVTETELKGLITHVAFYAGWPCAVNAGRIAIDVVGPTSLACSAIRWRKSSRTPAFPRGWHTSDPTASRARSRSASTAPVPRSCGVRFRTRPQFRH